MQSAKQPNSVSIDIVFNDSPEEFIMKHASNLERYNKLGLENRVISILESWTKKKIQIPRPLLFEKFDSSIQSENLQRTLNRINSLYFSDSGEARL